MEYNFNALREIDNIINHMRGYFSYTKNPVAVVGASGGVDSSVVLALCVEAFGKENVIAVQMPNNVQSDIDCSTKIINHLGLKGRLVNIGKITAELDNAILQNKDFYTKEKTENCYQHKTNTPARIRTSVLYAIAALEGGNMINTCNLSENICGFSTLYGDHAGGYSCLDQYTKTEVRAFGKQLGLPEDLVNKMPTDGMCGTGDEEKLSQITSIKDFTYERLDKLTRGLEHDFTSKDIESLIKLYRGGKFKTEIVQIPHFTPSFYNFFLDK